MSNIPFGPKQIGAIDPHFNPLKMLVHGLIPYVFQIPQIGLCTNYGSAMRKHIMQKFPTSAFSNNMSSRCIGTTVSTILSQLVSCLGILGNIFQTPTLLQGIRLRRLDLLLFHTLFLSNSFIWQHPLYIDRGLTELNKHHKYWIFSLEYHNLYNTSNEVQSSLHILYHKLHQNVKF